MAEKDKLARMELERIWSAVRADRVSGAGELLKLALESLRQYLETIESPDYAELGGIINDFGQLRRDMAGFANCARFINTEDLPSMLRSITYLHEYLEQCPEKIAKHSASVIGHSSTILTISRSSTVEAIVNACHERGVLEQVIQLESRPAFEGRRNAERFIRRGIDVIVIPDAAMGYWMNRADLVLVGADAIAQDGTFLGKIGCRALGVLAREAHIPLYVAAERLKFVPGMVDEDTANRNFSGEVLSWGIDSERLTFSNVIFECTPGHLVTSFITEYGLQNPPLTLLETLSF